MTDIVTELREAQAINPRRMRLAAADEITRLRAEVEALTHDIECYVQRDTERLAEVEALRADAERYRWLRQRMELRPMPTMSGTVRHGITMKIGCSFPDSPMPMSTNPEYHEERSKELDAAIDAARSAK